MYMKYLPNIASPEDLKQLTIDELTELAEELRLDIISSVSQTGGHLATNLGSVELTLALHYVFRLPQDRLIWDVSNQTYSHKILTGRRDRMNTLRQYRGLAGFAKRDESDYDHFGAGHASTSISAALGFAAARDNAGRDNKVVAIIGDGAMTGGLAYEGLNNAGSSKKDILVILNDNTWSISKNVGAMSRYLTSIMADEKFNKLRNEIWELTGRFKRRDKIRTTIARIEDSVMALVVPGMLFEKLGFRYFGPIDGHNLELVIKTLQDLKNLKGPLLLHVATVKGKGYGPAEGNPSKFHGVGKFDKITGIATAKPQGRPSYTKVFGNTMVELGAKNKDVIAITAAMAAGTGLVEFAEKYPERFFDVGIAEEHAGTFAAGLAAEGAKPYLTIYSTFLQRTYDQIIHDIALQNLPVVMCMDRGGLVGNDGPTHHGMFDLSYLATVPNVTVAAPKDGNELRAMLHYTAEHDLEGPVGIRYPRDSVPTEMRDEVDQIEWGTWEYLTAESDVTVLAVGTMVAQMQAVAEKLAEHDITVSIVNARFVKPFDYDILKKVMNTAKVVITIEENQVRGGFGEAVGAYLLSHGYQSKFKAIALPDRFITHGSRSELLQEVGLDVDTVAAQIESMVDQTEPSGLLQKLRLKRHGNGKKRGKDDLVRHSAGE